MKISFFKYPATRRIFVAAALVLGFCADALPKGPQKVVAVSRFENKTLFGGEIGEGMADQLADALVKSGQFIVVERQTLTDITAEQDWAASGRMKASQSAQTGKLLSAQIHVMGTITEFESQSSGSDSGVRFGGFRVGGKHERAHVGLILRLIDTTSGTILFSEKVEGKANAAGVDVAGSPQGIDFGTEAFGKTPLGKATHDAIANAVDLITRKLREIPYECSVVKAGEEEVIISAGERSGVKAGDVFDIYSREEELVDPVTGESLGSDEERVGSVQVYQIEEKFSRAKVLNASRAIQRGDAARYR
jgi:curli biogenesis system outer membrane secretion channel CsgG